MVEGGCSTSERRTAEQEGGPVAGAALLLSPTAPRTSAPLSRLLRSRSAAAVRCRWCILADSAARRPRPRTTSIWGRGPSAIRQIGSSAPQCPMLGAGVLLQQGGSWRRRTTCPLGLPRCLWRPTGAADSLEGVARRSRWLAGQGTPHQSGRSLWRPVVRVAPPALPPSPPPVALAAAAASRGGGCLPCSPWQGACPGCARRCRALARSVRGCGRGAPPPRCRGCSGTAPPLSPGVGVPPPAARREAVRGRPQARKVGCMCMPRQACTRSPILSAAGASPRSARRALAGLKPGSLLRAPGGLAPLRCAQQATQGRAPPDLPTWGAAPAPGRGWGTPCTRHFKRGPARCAGPLLNAPEAPSLRGPPPYLDT